MIDNNDKTTELSPPDFRTDVLKMFVEYFKEEGYLDNDLPSVPEIMTWLNVVPLRTLKNKSIEKLCHQTDPENMYFYAGNLSFAYASRIVSMWHENFDEFSKTNYEVEGLEEDFETALKVMDSSIVKNNSEIVSANEMTVVFLMLLSLLYNNLEMVGNVSDALYKQYVVAGMQAFFLLGMGIKLKLLGYK